MGCSVFAVGIRDLDGRFKDMVALKLMCDKTKTSYPKELLAYFEDAIEEHGTDELEDLEEETMERIMKEVNIPDEACEGDVDTDDGMLIELSKLPDDIKTIRVYMSC